MPDRSNPSADPQYISDASLNLTEEEIALLRQGQAALANSSSSRAASRASSQGRLLLDPSSLAALGRQFEELMEQIGQQITHLTEQSQRFTSDQSDHAGQLVEDAEAEIKRFNSIINQIDELELDFDRIAHIRDIVSSYRERVEEVESRMDRAGVGSGEGSGKKDKKDKKDRDRDGHKHHHHTSHRHGQSHRTVGHKNR